IDYRDASLLYATFDLTGKAAGFYDVVATDGAETASLTAALNVQPAEVPHVSVDVVVPQSIRVGRTGVAVVEYENTGNVDAVAPLLTLTATDAVLRLEEQGRFGGNRGEMLGIAPEGPAGVLRPGQRGSIRVVFQHTGAEETPIDFQLFQMTDGAEVIDWDGLKGTIKPGHIPDDAWDAIYPKLVDAAGPTL